MPKNKFVRVWPKADNIILMQGWGEGTRGPNKWYQSPGSEGRCDGPTCAELSMWYRTKDLQGCLVSKVFLSSSGTGGVSRWVITVVQDDLADQMV